MALDLSLDFQEQNDNKALILTDITVDWDVGGNPTPDLATAVTLTNVEYTSTDSSDPVTLLDVDLLTEFGPFSTQDDLVYTITNEMLRGSEYADTEIPDGLYQFDYNVTYPSQTDSLLNLTILVYGQVKVKVYEKFRTLNSNAYLCLDKTFKTELSETGLSGAYLFGIENSAYIAKTEELLDMLVVLEDIVTNGSNITW